MSRRSLLGLRTLVTGASSGIGLEISRELMGRGGRLAMAARNPSNLQKAADLVCVPQSGPPSVSSRPLVLPGDVTDPVWRAQALETCLQTWGGLDAVVMNAGIGATAPFLRIEPQEFRRVMEVNFFAIVDLLRDSLPLLVQGKTPIVVIIGSILGYFGLPDRSAYCASKFALRGFSACLRRELRSSSVHLLEVDPGRTSTDFERHQLRSERQLAPGVKGASAQSVARRTVAAMEQGKARIIPSALGRWIVLGNRLWPAGMERLFRSFGT